MLLSTENEYQGVISSTKYRPTTHFLFYIKQTHTSFSIIYGGKYWWDRILYFFIFSFSNVQLNEGKCISLFRVCSAWRRKTKTQWKFNGFFMFNTSVCIFIRPSRQRNPSWLKFCAWWCIWMNTKDWLYISTHKHTCRCLILRYAIFM